MSYNCVVVLGPTASGKTHLACQLAYSLNGEIISADSRQVYKHLDIGTGKDIHEYVVHDKVIPYHLINVIEPEIQFFLPDFISLCETVFNDIRERQRLPIICGGTGLYLDSLRKDFSLTQIPEDHDLRSRLAEETKEDLCKQLDRFPLEQTKHVDRNSKKRIIRAIEVNLFLENNSSSIVRDKRPYEPFYIGISVDSEVRRQRISKRLKYRLDNGLVEEVKELLIKGLSYDRLEFLGLEYKFVALYLKGELSLKEMTEQLETAIFQFAKRQMTWFRKMEKEGVIINWVSSEENVLRLATQIRPLLI